MTLEEWTDEISRMTPKQKEAVNYAMTFQGRNLMHAAFKRNWSHHNQLEKIYAAAPVKGEQQ